MIQTDVTLTGPLFTGEAVAALDEYAELLPDRLADEGVNLVRSALGGVLQNPTGGYEGQIQTDELASDRTSVWDGGMIQGAWLESGEYTPRTSFGGYGIWREATQALDGRATDIAQEAIGPFIERMNG